MELENRLNSPESNPFKISKEAYKSCPKCESYFLTETACEACGYQLDFEKLGEPLGDKSFYSMREFYWSQLSSIEKANNFQLENKSSEKAKRYIGRILMRYNDLLEFFYSENARSNPHFNIFFLELKDLVLELMKYDIPEKEIWKRVTDTESDGEDFEISLYQRIAYAIETGKQDRAKAKPSLQSLLSYRLGGVVNIVNLFFIFLTFIALVYGAISAYHYYNYFK